MDLPGLTISFTAIILAGLSLIAELALPPRRPDWKGFLAFQCGTMLFVTSVFLMYSFALIPGLSRPGYFRVLRTFAYISNPVIAAAALYWMGELGTVDRHRWRRPALLLPALLSGLLILTGMGIFSHYPAALAGILSGRLFLLWTLSALTLATFKSGMREAGAGFMVGVLFWAGLTAIEFRLDSRPNDLTLLNIWYIAGTAFFGGWTAASIILRRRRIERGRRLRETDADASPGHPLLTAREREIAAELVAGRSYREIADALFVSYGTVKTHVYRIYRKLGIRNKVELIQVLQDD